MRAICPTTPRAVGGRRMVYHVKRCRRCGRRMGIVRDNIFICKSCRIVGRICLLDGDLNCRSYNCLVGTSCP